MPTKNNVIKKIIGFTLIELMLGVALSALIMIYLITIYLAVLQNQNSQIALSTLKENSEILSPLLLSAIHGAGYMGCARLTDDFPLSNKTDYQLTAKNRVVVQDDTLITRQASFHMAMLSKNMQDKSIFYLTKMVENLSQGDIVLISNCKTADIAKVKNILSLVNGSQRIMTESPLSVLYSANTEVRKLEINTYYIAATNRKNARGELIYALYVKNFQQEKIEKLEGINAMKIKVDKNLNDEISGLSFKFILSSLNYFLVEKPWYLYASMREIA